MGKSFLYLLTMVAVLQLSSVRTRYLLIELAKEEGIQVSVRNGRSCVPTEKTFACNSDSEIYSLASQGNVISCSKDIDDHCKGNYIEYELKREGDQDILELESINAEMCKPKPMKCHCGVMLDKLLKRYDNVDRIDGAFMGNSFIQICRCVLNSAAWFGFEFVEFSAVGCSGKKEFSKTDYVEVCEAMEKKRLKCEKVGTKLVGIAKVTRK